MKLWILVTYNMFPTMRLSSGWAKEYVSMMHAALPDLKMIIEDMVA